jgi:hypothetical protein
MPFKDLLEEYPLYKKFEVEQLPQWPVQLGRPNITMPCRTCGGVQTFHMQNSWSDGQAQGTYAFGATLFARYLCQSCQKFTRYFAVNIGAKSVMKVGQFPPWDIAGDAEIEKMLGAHATHYKRGLICESQGYGIGAFAYYRRIVEEIIDQLLDDVSALLSGEEKAAYEEALKKTKETRVAAEKIELVKDLLPPILRPDGMNPLATLHGTLSEGLHAESDDECMKSALAVRQILTFLVHQVAASRASARAFTDSMRNLLGKKAAKPQVAEEPAAEAAPVELAPAAVEKPKTEPVQGS